MRVYADTNNVEDAVDKLLPPTKTTKRPTKPVRELTDEEKQIKELRTALKQMDDERLTSSNPRGFSVPAAHYNRPEETAPQNSYYQECQLPSPESKEQTPGTACP